MCTAELDVREEALSGGGALQCHQSARRQLGDILQQLARLFLAPDAAAAAAAAAAGHDDEEVGVARRGVARAHHRGNGPTGQHDAGGSSATILIEPGERRMGRE